MSLRSCVHLQVVLLALVLLGFPEPAAAAPRSKVRVVLPSAVTAGISMPVTGVILVPGANRVRVERRSARGWVRVASGAVRRRRLKGLIVKVPRAAGTLAVRVVAQRGRRTVATSAVQRVTVRRGPILVKRRGTLELPAGRITRVLADSRSIVLKAGSGVPATGEVLVAPIGKTAPRGFIGKVLRIEGRPGGEIKVVTRPAALDEAYKRFSARREGTLGELAGSARMSAAPTPVKFDCRTGSGFGPRVEAEVDISRMRFTAELDTFGPSLLVLLTGKPEFSLDFAFTGQVTCTSQPSKALFLPIAGPLGVAIRPAFTFDAGGKFGGKFTWRPRLAYGFFRSRTSGNYDINTFASDGGVEVYGEAGLTAFLGLNLEASVGGQAGIGGSVGPELTGTASVSNGRNCVAVEGSARAQLTASADVFVKSWTFALATLTFGRHQLFTRCTGGGSGGTGPGSEGDGGAGSGSGSDGGGESSPGESVWERTLPKAVAGYLYQTRIPKQTSSSFVVSDVSAPDKPAWLSIGEFGTLGGLAGAPGDHVFDASWFETPDGHDPGPLLRGRLTIPVVSSPELPSTALPAIGLAQPYGSGDDIQALRPSPDGQYLAVTYGGLLTGAPVVGLYERATETMTLLTQGTSSSGTNAGVGVDNLAWSPDSTRLAFSSQEELDGPVSNPFNENIYVYNLVTGDLRRVSNTSDENRVRVAHNSAWSPDGTLLAYNTEPVRKAGVSDDQIAIWDAGAGATTKLSCGEHRRCTFHTYSEDDATAPWSSGSEHLTFTDELMYNSDPDAIRQMTWDRATGVSRELDLGRSSILNRQGSKLLTQDGSGAASVIDISSGGRENFTLPSQVNQWNSSSPASYPNAWSPNGRYVVDASRRRALDTETGTLVGDGQPSRLTGWRGSERLDCAAYQGQPATLRTCDSMDVATGAASTVTLAGRSVTRTDADKVFVTNWDPETTLLWLEERPWPVEGG